MKLLQLTWVIATLSCLAVQAGCDKNNAGDDGMAGDMGMVPDATADMAPADMTVPDMALPDMAPPDAAPDQAVDDPCDPDPCDRTLFEWCTVQDGGPVCNSASNYAVTESFITRVTVDDFLCAVQLGENVFCPPSFPEVPRRIAEGEEKMPLEEFETGQCVPEDPLDAPSRFYPGRATGCGVYERARLAWDDGDIFGIDFGTEIPDDPITDNYTAVVHWEPGAETSLIELDPEGTLRTKLPEEATVRYNYERDFQADGNLEQFDRDVRAVNRGCVPQPGTPCNTIECEYSATLVVGLTHPEFPRHPDFPNEQDGVLVITEFAHPDALGGSYAFLMEPQNGPCVPGVSFFQEAWPLDLEGNPISVDGLDLMKQRRMPMSHVRWVWNLFGKAMSFGSQDLGVLVRDQDGRVVNRKGIFRDLQGVELNATGQFRLPTPPRGE